MALSNWPRSKNVLPCVNSSRAVSASSARATLAPRTRNRTAATAGRTPKARLRTTCIVSGRLRRGKSNGARLAARPLGATHAWGQLEGGFAVAEDAHRARGLRDDDGDGVRVARDSGRGHVPRAETQRQVQLFLLLEVQVP